MIAAKIDAGIPKVSNYAFAFLAGFFVSCWWFQTGTFEKVKQALPAAVSAANCERSLAGFDAKLAHAPVVLEDGQIPVDHCPHPKVDVPPVQK